MSKQGWAITNHSINGKIDSPKYFSATAMEVYVERNIKESEVPINEAGQDK